MRKAEWPPGGIRAKCKEWSVSLEFSAAVVFKIRTLVLLQACGGSEQMARMIGKWIVRMDSKSAARGAAISSHTWDDVLNDARASDL